MLINPHGEGRPVAIGDEQSSGFLAGDKVRIRGGPHRGLRGIVEGETDGIFEVELEGGEIVHIPRHEVTNYSLAARKAWAKLPKKAGRPKTELSTKRRVTVRIEAELWERLGAAAATGLIRSRESAINAWVREKLDSLNPQESGHVVANAHSKEK
jgi:hypothetical protein